MINSKLAQQIAQGFRLIQSGRGLDKGVLCLYLGLNAVSKITRLPLPRRTMTLRLAPDLTVTCNALSSQLGPYVEIFPERIYERLPEFNARPGQVVFDVGASIGFYTLRQARAVGPTGHVYAFEPDPRSFQLLKQNVAKNGFTWVTCLPYAVSSSSDSKAVFWSSPRCATTASLFHDPKRNGAQRYDVEAVCLDDFVEVQGIERIDVLKMDAEGAEPLIVEGGLGKAIPITQRVVMESHNTREKVRELLKPFGFDMTLDYRKRHVVYFTRPAGVLSTPSR